MTCEPAGVRFVGEVTRPQMRILVMSGSVTFHGRRRGRQTFRIIGGRMMRLAGDIVRLSLPMEGGDPDIIDLSRSAVIRVAPFWHRTQQKRRGDYRFCRTCRRMSGQEVRTNRGGRRLLIECSRCGHEWTARSGQR